MIWRTIGDIPRAVWLRELDLSGSPLRRVDLDAYNAAKPHTALCLAMLRVESQFGTAFNANVEANKNYLNLRPPAGNGYMAFQTPVAGIAAWRERITSSTYKDGIYARTVTISELIHVYAPSSDNNNEAAYVASIERDLARWGITEGTPMATPAIFDLMRDYARYGISQEDAATVRSYRFENRNGQQPTFIVLHIQAGTTRSSLDWWANGVVNGNRVTASSTVMIQKDGSILQVIPEQHAPWTNGDDNRPTAAGQRLVNLPGNSNLHTLSIEAEGMSGADTTPTQLDSIVWQVNTWIAKYNIPKTNVIRHGDINSVDRPNCPGAFYPLVMARIGAGSSPYAEPASISWQRGDVGVQDLNGVKALAFVIEVECVKAAGAQPVASSAKGAPKTGPLIKLGEKRVAIGSYKAGAANNAWIVLDGGHRVKRSAFLPGVPLI